MIDDPPSPPHPIHDPIERDGPPLSAGTELDDVATRVAMLLIQRGESVAVAESSAGGLISAALLAVPGASSYFVGGAVAYTATSREALLGITRRQMEGIRSSSEPYAQLLARTVRERLGATWGLAETGAAGPTGNRYGDPAGHCCLAVSGPVERVVTIATDSLSRSVNMREFERSALELLETELRGHEGGLLPEESR